MRTLLTLLVIICIVPTTDAQQIFSTPLSPRIANYDIKVSLDDVAKTLDGSMVLHWTNTSKDTLTELQFHLYLNAFRNTQSTLMVESGSQYRDEYAQKPDDFWGWIDIESMRIRGGEELASKIQFIHPDDDNVHDRTAIRIPLRDSIYPGQTLDIDIEFLSKLPQVTQRTGYSGDFFFVAQWFPKIAVYESAGDRYEQKGAWNCHQFHANSEFFADFGVYNVEITLPKKYITGSCGLWMDEKENTDGTKTVSYRAEDIVDFAWTAYPRYKVVQDEWEHIQIRLLIQPEHYEQASRHIEAAKATFAYMQKYLGKYPYPYVTIVDPPMEGQNAGGMEYTTLFTVGTVWKMPKGIRMPELVTVHELGHAYFMGILASNEFEEAWLDEGFNSYFESRIMDDTYGNKTSVINTLGIRVGNVEMQRNSYTASSNPRIAPSFRPAWGFTHGGYGMLTYSKPATWLNSLERMIGSTVMDSIMQTYFNRWSFKHPCATDFIAIVNEIVPRAHGNKFGENMDWFFEQVLYGTQVCDYKMASLKSRRIIPAKGNNATTHDHESEYKTTVIVHRLGDMHMPLDILVTFENGDRALEFWDGKSPSQEFVYYKDSKAISAVIDPDNKNLMDTNILNNSITLQTDNRPIWKYTSKLLFWIQNILQLFSVLV